MTTDLSIPDAELAQQPVPSRHVIPAPSPASVLLAAFASGKTQLAKAILGAQKLCKPVPPDKRNEFHKYNYASAEAIITEGRQALIESGLALIPVESSVDGWDREGENRYELVRQLVLVHESGEAVPITMRTPIVPEKGRPLDKAAAAADTLGLSYFIRDLLLMPRVAPGDDVAGREDREAPAVTLHEPQVKELRNLLERKGFSVASLCRRYKVRRLSALTVEQYAEAKAGLVKLADKAPEQAAAAGRQPAPQQQPAQKPAGAAGDHDPAELISREERLVLARLIQAGNLKWADCRNELGLSLDTGLAEVTYGQLPTVRAWLEDHQPKKG